MCARFARSCAYRHTRNGASGPILSAMGRLFAFPAAAGLILVLLAACAPFRGYPERATAPSRDLELLAPAIDANQILACLRVTDATGARECRNQLVTARVY